MSYHSCPQPESHAGAGVVAHVIDTRSRDLGGLMVRRALPSARRRLVGPFVFFDHMGPAEFAPGQGLDVRPHPHIGLATVTFLFEGEILHRDSLGYRQPIRPGAVNWMTAGRGIVHSERTDEELRRRGARLHGIQSWVALPLEHEETEPSFVHYPADRLPVLRRDGATLHVVAGEVFGARSPVATHSPLFYLQADLERDAEVALEGELGERAAYVVSGEVEVDGTRYRATELLVFRDGPRAILRAPSPAVVMLFGGAPLEGQRHIWWNFVSSSRERIERAKDDWRSGRFGKVPGDEQEFIPLPE